MRIIGKFILIIIILGLLLGTSAYIIVYTEDNPDIKNDNEPPQIIQITGNLTVTAGRTAIIQANFTDNINVTNATFYYKIAGSTAWNQQPMLTGTTSIYISPGTTSNYYYYLTIDDAAGNGPIGAPSTDGSSYYIITVQPSGGNNDNEPLTHTVFIEETTATWCNNCPNIANILYSLYQSNKYNFYYVALIEDSNTVAKQRIYDDYNVWGLPTVFIDGGYNVIIGGNNEESVYANAINVAQGRIVPQIKITVTAQYKNTTDEVTVTTLIENKDDETYNGRIKLYLTEIVSKISDYANKKYHYGFLEYLMNEAISVDAKDEITKSVTKNISAYDYENLMIIGVVFSSQKNIGYTNPPDKNPFDAYYADAVNATKLVSKGNLPPEAQITSPQKGSIYFNGKELVKLQSISLLKNFLHNKTFLFGKNKIITVQATDDSAIAKVEFYIDGNLQYNDTQAPYEWSFVKLSTMKSIRLKTHNLEIIVFDDTGKNIILSTSFKAWI